MRRLYEKLSLSVSETNFGTEGSNFMAPTQWIRELYFFHVYFLFAV